MKNAIIIAGLVVYLLIGFSIYLIGETTKDLSFSQQLFSIITVTIGWPFFLVGHIWTHI